MDEDWRYQCRECGDWLGSDDDYCREEVNYRTNVEIFWEELNV